MPKITYEELLQKIRQAQASGQTTLNLSNTGLTALPPQIGQLTALTTLDLRTLFADKRIYPWRNELPQANTPAARTRAVVDYLHNRYSTTGDNALVLFLHVLADHTNPADALHLTLRTLAHALASLIQRPAA